MSSNQMSVAEVKSTMLNAFGFSDFKSPWQEEAVMKIYQGHKNVIVSFPTHGGKSLTFQIQSVLRKNETILVFCPSLALMKNQVIYLRSRGLNAECINSNTEYERRDEIIKDLQENPSPIQFLYVTPEMFSSNFYLASVLKNLISIKKVSMIVVDEAHLIEDLKFVRENFMVVPQLRQELPDVQWVALTTVSQSMLPKLESSLQMENSVVITAPTARENIFYDVMVTENNFEGLKKSIEEFTNNEGSPTSGIVYVGSISNIDRFVFLLKSEGFSAESYYADKTDRFEIQDKWMLGEIDILVATAESFGSGIMRNSVKFVIHMSVPMNMRAMYQESGRAGVNGEKSFSRIILESAWSSGELSGYLATKDCRRRFISQFFEEKSADCVSMCDNCILKYSNAV